MPNDKRHSFETDNSGKTFLSTWIKVVKVTYSFLRLLVRCIREVAQSCCLLRLVSPREETWRQLVCFPGILYLNFSLNSSEKIQVF
jgi:hypothetical protein